jgi:hypothetical protein
MAVALAAAALHRARVVDLAQLPAQAEQVLAVAVQVLDRAQVAAVQEVAPVVLAHPLAQAEQAVVAAGQAHLLVRAEPAPVQGPIPAQVVVLAPSLAQAALAAIRAEPVMPGLVQAAAMPVHPIHLAAAAPILGQWRAAMAMAVQMILAPAPATHPAVTRMLAMRDIQAVIRAQAARVILAAMAEWMADWMAATPETLAAMAATAAALVPVITARAAAAAARSPSAITAWATPAWAKPVWAMTLVRVAAAAMMAAVITVGQVETLARAAAAVARSPSAITVWAIPYPQV